MVGYELKSDNHTCTGDVYVSIYMHKYMGNPHAYDMLKYMQSYSVAIIAYYKYLIIYEYSLNKNVLIYVYISNTFTS